jgi:PAS domain S-box-containing protein
MVATYQPDGTRDFINQPWLDYAGLTRQEAEGEGRKSPVHPDDAKRVQDAWRASLASGEPFLTEVRVRAANGDYRWHTIRRVPRRDEKGDVVKWYGVGHDIDDQKKAESALRRGEAQLAAAKRELQATIDTIPTLIASYWPNGERDFVNLAWERFTGISQEEARGKSSTITFHPDRQAPGESEWRACLAKGEAYEVEERLRRADGEYRWHWIGRVPLRDENGDVTKWYGVGHDIEDRKRAESALQRSRAYLAEAQKLSQTGSFAWGDVNDDHFWSDQTYEIFGVDRSVRPSVEIVAQRVHPDDRLIFEHEVRRAERGARKHDYELRLLMPDGATKHLHIVSHRIKYESGKEELVGAMMDVTEARKSQETLHAAQSALHHASRVATLGEISATIAHEVNQPLAAIVTNGQACLRILRSESPDLDDVRGAVDWIVKDGNRAGEVIRRVRGLMKKADAQQVPLDVNDMISEVAALLQGELAAQHVSLRQDLAPSMALAAADRIQLQQVIINLIMNGIEAMQTVADRPRALVIRSHQDEAGRVAVAVKDGGIGIPADTADRLFEAFFSTKPSGLGMGLSICRSIIEDHGGRLWARDNNDEPGATFQFALPSLRDSMA